MNRARWGIVSAGATIAVAVLVITLVRSSSAQPSATSGEVDLWPPLAETFNFRDIVTTPVDQDVVPVVSSDQAIANVENSGFSVELRPGDPEVALRLATNDLDGGTPDPYGIDALSYYERLSWVVVYHNSQAAIFGPAAPDGQAPDIPDQSCIMLFVVDAVDGSVFDVRQLCVDVA